MVIPERIRITKIDDLSPPEFTGSGDREDNDDLCIYTNMRTGSYKVTARGDGPGGEFSLRDKLGHRLNYQLRWNDKNGTTNNTPLENGIPLHSQQGASIETENCGGGTNANVQVIFSEEVMLASDSGVYEGEVTLLVEPE